MSEPLHVNGQDIYITNSVGVSIFPEDGYDATTLLKNADAAMYKAKDDGKNTYQFYKEEMTEKAFERLLMENSLRQALENEEFVVHYQPQIDTKTEELVGMEALVRWNHPSMGLVPPSKFIPLAEETGLIVQLDRWVMKTAMNQISKWNSNSSKNKFVSLNLSMKQLDQKDFLEFVKKSLLETKCLPSFIELEITESQIMKDAKKCIHILEKVKELGILISIDDFGTGYSSLSYLKKFPISKIKIDQSFVRDLPTDEDDVALVKAIISIAKNLNLSTIAEGVETNEQREFMLKHGCDKIQGYFYSKPIPSDEMEKLLEKGIN
jgi:EAL domain-containing protein (putative c-di-GMP-specific phosphodiesterase class I)